MYSDTKIPLLTSYIETVSTFAKPIFSRSQECWPSLYFLQFFLTSNWRKETLVVRFQNHRANSDKSYFSKFVIHHFAQECGCRTKTNMDIIQETYKQTNKCHYSSSFLNICSSPAHRVVFHFNQKSVNLQYNTLVCWADGTNDSSFFFIKLQKWK